MSIALNDLHSLRNPEKEPDLSIAAVSRHTFKLLWMNESWKRIYPADNDAKKTHLSYDCFDNSYSITK